MLGTVTNCSTSGRLNQKIQIKDQVWYAAKDYPGTGLGAVELHTLSNAKRQVSKSEWDKIRPGMLCTYPKTFGENKKLLETLCAHYGYCTYEEVIQVISTVGYLQRAGVASPKSLMSGEVVNNNIYFKEELAKE